MNTLDLRSEESVRYLARNYARRKFFNRLACLALVLAAAMALLPLFNIFIYTLQRGMPAINWAFFTSTPKPVGQEGGGMANALVGTIVIVLIASAIGVPWGVSAGLYLSEYGRGKLAKVIRFCAEMLSSVPSIVVGLFVYAMVVKPMGRFSAWAGGVALAIIMVPTVARTTEELLKLVPQHLREAGLALGLPRWKVTLYIVLKGSLKGISTGVMLSIARAAGETAPLLFTAFGNQYWSAALDQPIASVPVQIYTYAISPFDEWQRQAWAGAVLLVLLVFLMNLMTRIVIRTPRSAE